MFRTVARFGFAVNGALHILVGAIAISIALGGRHQEIDRSGALQQVAATPGGIAGLWIAVIALGALGLWELIQAFIATGRKRRKRWVARSTAGGRALVYLILCGAALSFAVGASHSSARASRGMSAAVMAAPGGVVLLVMIGLTIAGVGGYFVYLGIAGRFLKDIRMPRGVPGVVTVTIGRVGYVGEGIVLAIVGILFVVGAVTFDSSKTTGLDGSLKALAALPFGELLLALVAVGLLIYGLYGIIRARLQILS